MNVESRLKVMIGRMMMNESSEAIPQETSSAHATTTFEPSNTIFIFPTWYMIG